jgi:hypothetical protein
MRHKSKIVSKASRPCGCLEYIRQNAKGQPLPSEILPCAKCRGDDAVAGENPLDHLMNKSSVGKHNRIFKIPIKFAPCSDMPVYLSEPTRYNYWATYFLVLGSCTIFFTILVCLLNLKEIFPTATTKMVQNSVYPSWNNIKTSSPVQSPDTSLKSDHEWWKTPGWSAPGSPKLRLQEEGTHLKQFYDSYPSMRSNEAKP